MKIMHKLFIAIILCIASLGINQNAIAQQDITEINTRQLKRYGEKALAAGDLFTAIDYLSAYIKEKPNDAKVLFTLGELYFKERNYPEAEKYYLDAFKAKRRKYPQAQFKYAECLKMQGKYEDALREFNIFKRYRKDLKSKDQKYYKDRMRSEIEGIEMLLADTLNTNFLVNNLGKPINHKHIDFNPMMIDENRLVFASLQLDNVKYFDPVKDSIPKRKFYEAFKQGNSWKITGEFGDEQINSPDFNTGNGAFSPDGNRFYFTRCSREFDERIICRIWLSKLENNQWQTPEILPEIINDPYYTSTMPAVGISRRNTDMLYFVSDREGTNGGMDIWYSYYDPRREEWKSPRNSGRKINTVGDEMTPFYDADRKTLYFASNGHPNIGGLDIFKTRGSGRSFNEPKNMKQPVNSSYDDLYYNVYKEGYTGYFVSNRPGGQSLRHETCCDDIYQFIDSDYIRIWLTGEIYGITDLDFYNSIRAEYEQDMRLDHVTTDKDTASVKLLHKYPVSLFMIDPETTEEIFIKTDSTEKGRFWFNLEQGIDYRLKVKDFNRDEKVFALTTKPITQDDTIIMDAIIVNTIPTEPITLKNVYYEYDKAELTKEAERVIHNTIYKLLKEHPTIIVEISSHTDSVASNEYNMELSQKRAESVVNFLMEKGISEEQMTAKGYGEENPIAPNSNPDGTDNEEGRAKNRRTEFRIIGELEEYSDIIYEE
jgi:outer membrane protein OmpA-like peptidoglycan-associated protein